MEKSCKSYVNEYPSVECVNCGEALHNYLPHKPMTVFDRIKSMTEEELAVAAFRLAHANDKPLSVQDMLERLRQPWKENEK